MRFDAKIVGVGLVAAAAVTAAYLSSNKREEMRFRTVMRDGAFSVRDYPRLLVVETITPGPRADALPIGWSRLSAFLSSNGGNIPVAMPVLADGLEGDGEDWRTRFVIHESIDRDQLPAAQEGIAVRALQPRRIAAIRFSGSGTDWALREHEADLRAWMHRRGVKAAGPAEHAYYDYDTALTPALLRRTEVIIPLAA